MLKREFAPLLVNVEHDSMERDKADICPVSSGSAVFPGSPKYNRMEQRHCGGPHGVLLQQLDDPAVPAAPAGVHPAQLLPLPQVSGTFTRCHIGVFPRPTWMSISPKSHLLN